MKMFKNKNLAYGAAALLLGAMAFSACSSDDDIANVNPSFDGESVKTQFAINIPRAAQTKTRMTSANTQATENDGFLGMQDIRLIPFSLASGVTGPGSENIASVISLPNLTTSDIHGTGDSERSSKIYNDVTIPVGTNHFLFYGQATRTTSDGVDFSKGSLTTTLEGAAKVSDITFALTDILAADASPFSSTEATALLNVLNTVEKVEDWSNSGDDTALGKLYKTFTGIDDATGIKAGSASSIRAALESLYNAVYGLHKEDNDIAAEIMEAIKTGNVFTVTEDKDYGYKLSTSNNFPRNLNLPDGAVAVSFNSQAEAGKKFSYVDPSQTQTTGTTANQINVKNVTYPASLYYYADTELKATNDIYNDWPTTTGKWTQGFTDWGDKVLATTQSIAMKDNVNYGVGNLALAVRTAAATLADKAVNGVQRTIIVGDETFPITAILIGGQPAEVNYAFAPVSTTFAKTIYDKVESGKYATYTSGDAEVCNYTLALPNTQNEAQAVQFAIELENNSGFEFVGHNNQIIYNGSKFYLVGKLNPSSETGMTKPDGSSVQNVFESDYITTAKVKITSLENAYNVIPDLRATNLQFGLSVDLKWEEGITFEVEVGKE